MNEQEQHEMVLAGTLPSGAEEWSCPICGRRVLINWGPKFKRTIVASGNPDATHSGFKQNIQMQDFTIASGGQASSYEYNEDVNLNIDENRLTPWESWLDKNGFDDME